MKPCVVRCGGCCMIQILNHESALGMDQISIDPPIFQKFFAFWGTAWGV
nr:MAG TPA: PDGF/VEGF domain protein [Caudoviricetes sp.]